MAEPISGVAYEFSTSLVPASGSGFQVDPTIAAGDFQVQTDGGVFANLSTLPVVSQSGHSSVDFVLSASEMGTAGEGAKINIEGLDASGDEWQDININIDAPASSAESATDILEGDIIETSTSQRVNKKGTTTALVDKDIGGSLLSPSVTITTTESS